VCQDQLAESRLSTSEGSSCKPGCSVIFTTASEPEVVLADLMHTEYTFYCATH